MLQMYKMWDKGVTTGQFRQCEMSDLMFIYEMDKIKGDNKKKMAHEQKIKNAMAQLQRGGAR